MVWWPSSNLQICLESACSFKVCGITFVAVRLDCDKEKRQNMAWKRLVFQTSFPCLTCLCIAEYISLESESFKFFRWAWDNLVLKVVPSRANWITQTLKSVFTSLSKVIRYNANSTSLVMHTSSLTFITYRKLTSWLVNRNITAASTQSKFSNEVKRSENRKKN